MALNDYVMDQEMRRRRLEEQAYQAALTAQQTAAADAEFATASMEHTIGPKSGGLLENLTHEKPLSADKSVELNALAHTRPEGFTYDEPNQDLKALITSQYEQQILEEALDAEAWEKERLRLIQEDNKLGMLVSLVTKQPYKPMSVSANITAGTAGAKSNALKKKKQLEFATIDNRLVENPPRNKDELFEFGDSLNLTTDGWTHLFNRFPQFDWGKVLEWKKLNDDGTMEVSYSAEGNNARNDELRGLGFTTKSLADNRADRIAQGYRRVSDAVYAALQGKGLPDLNSEVWERMQVESRDLFLDPFAIPALNHLQEKYLDTKAQTVLMIRGDGAQVAVKNDPTAILNKQKEGFTLATGEGLNKLFVNNKKDEVIENIAVKLSPLRAHVASNPELVKTQIKEAILAEIGEEHAYLLGDSENMVKAVLARFGVDAQRVENEGILSDYIDEVLDKEGMTQQKALSSLRKGAPITRDGKKIRVKPTKPQLEALSKVVKDAFTPTDFGKTGQKLASGVAILNKHGEKRYVQTDEVFVRGPNNTSVPLERASKAYATSDNGKKMWVPLFREVDDPDSDDPDKTIVEEVQGMMVWQPQSAWIKPVVANLRKNITDKFAGKTEFNDALNSYHGITESFEQLGKFGKSISVGNLDKQIGTLVIKLRDTSMVTEGEFKALQATAGWKDRIGNITDEFLEGAVFTPKQRTTMLLLIDQWIRSKLRRSQNDVAEQKENLTRKLRGSIYDKASGDVGLGDMNEFINELMLDAGVPLKVLEGGDIRSMKEIIGRDVSNLFSALPQTPTGTKGPAGETLEQREERLDKENAERANRQRSRGVSAKDLLK